jgi:Methylamine utilisation protein MauE
MQAAALLTLPLSGVLLWAGLEKLRERRQFIRTLAELGFSDQTRRALAVTVPCVELSTAGGLLLAPSMTWPRGALAALGGAFAAAGLLAVRARRPIACSCLGASGSTLGRRQIGLLPAWLCAAVTLHLLAPDWSTQLGVQYLAGVVLGIGGLRAIDVAKAARGAVGNRRAIDEAARVRTAIVVRTKEVEAL